MARRAPSDAAIIGRIVRPHGLAGEVVIELLTPDAGCCEPGSELWIAGGWQRVTHCRLDNKGRALAAFDGVADRDAAESLRGADVAVEAADLPALSAGRFYIHDLVGCRVEDLAGDEVGKVVAVVNGPQDLLEVEHERTRSLLPMARDLVREVDIVGRRIVVDLPSGLLEA